MDFQTHLDQTAQAITAALDTALPRDTTLAKAMRHATLGAGKRLRGFLTCASADLFQIPHQTALHAAVAIESLHAYSLVHDDLPAMDNDDLRRGQPTVHVKWDEATAILVGDALQSFAFHHLTHLPMPADIRVELIGALAEAAQKMVQGQAQDMSAQTAHTHTIADITDLQQKKTGALIEWAATAGSRLAGNTGAEFHALQNYAQPIGLAYQIRDDILDNEGEATHLGKRAQKDDSANKATFVSLLGMDGAKAQADILAGQAIDALSPFGDRGKTLSALARFVITRKR